MATNNLSIYDKEKIGNAKPYKFGIVVSQWNKHITQALQKGAVETLVDLGAEKENIIIVEVPGSFELIYGARAIAEECDAVIAIGCVIRGETAHFDYVCQGVTHGIKDLNIQQNTPIIFCVLTDENEEQSLSRSGGKHGNKGVEAAVAATHMAILKNELIH